MNQELNKTAIVYSKEGCVWCVAAASVLKTAGYSVNLKKIDIYNEDRLEMLSHFPGARTVPQIILDGTPIGEYTKMVAYLKNDKT